jgi:hypothetical protein
MESKYYMKIISLFYGLAEKSLPLENLYSIN